MNVIDAQFSKLELGMVISGRGTFRNWSQGLWPSVAPMATNVLLISKQDIQKK